MAASRPILARIVVAALVLALVACERSSPSDRAIVVAVAPPSDAAPPALLSASPASTAKPSPSECPGATFGDPALSHVLPLGAEGFCIDGASTKSYGADGRYTMDQVCTTLLDGECELYIKQRVRRIVSTRYVSRVDPANVVSVILSQFNDARGASAMFGERVMSLDESQHRKTIGNEIVIGPSTAYVCRGAYLAELTIDSENPSITRPALVRMNEVVNGGLAVQIDALLR